MKLPFMSLFQKKAPTDYFLALLFRDEKIHAVVFEQINGRIQVVGQGKATLTASLERASDEMLLDSADKAISIAEESLPNGITTQKTVFGVKETWVEDTHISQNYLSRLKAISEQLDLKPIGFLVFPEAIAHLLQKEEGAPVSAILVETGQKQVVITLLRAGRIVGTQEVPATDDITATVEGALKQFENIEIFPSRIILFDSQDAGVEKKFVTHRWSKALPFLHVPQITTLPSDFDTRAILFGTATQMGLDAIDLIKQPLKKADTFFEEPNGTKETEETKAEELEAEKSEEMAEQSANRLQTTAEKEAAASSSKAVGNTGDDWQDPKQKEESLEEVTGADTSEYFGFVKDADIAEGISKPHTSPLPSDALKPVTEELLEEEKEEELAGEAPGFSKSGAIFVQGAKKTYKQVQQFLPKQFSLTPVMSVFSSLTKNFPSNGNRLLLFIPIVIIILLLGFFWYIFALHAKVTLFLTPKTISQDQSVTFATTGSTDPSKNLIAADSVSTTEDGKTSGNATGTKDIGDKAKGTVTIFNIDDSSHSFNSGTVITCSEHCSSSLKFTLDSTVTVASGSSDPTNPSAGTVDVKVTAQDIGTDYNIPSGAKFSFSGISTVAAKNSSAFSGGTKKSITVVTQKDLDSIANDLIDSLKEKAKSDINGKAGSEEIILPDFTKTTVTKSLYDKKVGDEAKSINLDGSVTFETIMYKKSDIEKYTKTVLSQQLSSGLTLSADGITYSVKDMTTKDGTTKVTLVMKAVLIPSLDTKSLSAQIAGKSFAQARDILSGVQQFSDVTFTLSPNLFFLPKSLPRMSGNITISIVAHE